MFINSPDTLLFNIIIIVIIGTGTRVQLSGSLIRYILYIQPSNFLYSHHSNTMKFLPMLCSKNSYKQFFPNTIPQWNNLSTEVVNSQSLITFKLCICN